MEKRPVIIPITYPEPDFKITKKEGRQWIWDAVRKKEIRLTPEEWVRQNFISYLIKGLQYPPALLSVEKGIRVGSLKRRYDIVVFKASQPWMIVECKEPETPINEKVIAQILAYNLPLQASYLILTNGKKTYGIRRDQTSWNYIRRLPEWKNAD